MKDVFNTHKKMNESGSAFRKRISELNIEMRQEKDKLNNLRADYLNYVTGPTLYKPENRLMAREILGKIKSQKRYMKKKGFL